MKKTIKKVKELYKELNEILEEYRLTDHPSTDNDAKEIESQMNLLKDIMNDSNSSVEMWKTLYKHESTKDYSND